MLRWITSLLIFSSLGAFAQQKTDHIKILKLLPYVVHPPLVNPYLPSDFTLGEKKDDPYFSTGYYWGDKGSISDYFEDPSALKGCLIRSQVATTVTQTGFDRFSNDGEVNDLTAAGFTEIKVTRGKWGIFPYRELLAKSPRGRRYYQMWVGLNTQEGATLCFQFLYPEYLNEPTQNQKQIWDNFVRRTSLLDMNDLLIARGVDLSADFAEGDKLSQKISFIAQKRRFDQKIFIQIQPIASIDSNVEILGIEDVRFFNELNLGIPFIEIHATFKDGETISEKIHTSYEIVEQFPFETKMLSLNRFEESENYLLFK